MAIKTRQLSFWDLVPTEVTTTDAQLRQVIDAVRGQLPTAQDIQAMITEEVTRHQAETPAPAPDPEVDYSRIQAMIADAVAKAVSSSPSPAPAQAVTITLVQPPDQPRDLTGHHHAQFATLLRTVSAGVPAALAGPAGSGKTYAARQVAEALDRPFFSISVGPETVKSELAGYRTATGEYVESEVYKAMTQGGILLLDEFDAGNADSLTWLNAILANGYGSFPCGRIDAAPGFAVIVCTNTFGYGPDNQYVGRQLLDAATRNRFRWIAWDYDLSLEEALSVNAEWLAIVRKARKAARELCYDVVISPRTTINGDKLLAAGVSMDDCMDSLIWPGLPAEQISVLKTRMQR